ncbi:uncharacterized protein N7506_000043, partial [Penicillium brevicompactum]|uniref:uncharacterized protein n=1 Tax=Penicillium brevicompactum TaxID=5074 RepID=UPI00253FA6B7
NCISLPRNCFPAPILMFPGVFAADCNSTWIKSAADADALRRDCPIVYGHVGIGPFNGTSTVHINLDGIEMIGGTLGEYPYSRDEYTTQPYYTLSSSTLGSVDAVEIGHYDSKIVNLTLPNLDYVDDDFKVGQSAYHLTSLDITSLDTASTIKLYAPNLTTLHHTRLRNVSSLIVYPMKIDSLNSLTDNPIALQYATFDGPFPNINNITIGFKSVEDLRINDNSSVAIGGSSTKDMNITQLRLSGGVIDFQRSAQLDSLKVDSLDLQEPISITDLELPFDNLRSLKIRQKEETRPLKSITLPPQALDWTGGFHLYIASAPELNLTSLYSQDNSTQTWYWPRNVSYIYMTEVTTSNAFFDPFVAQQNAPLESKYPPSVLSSFSVIPSINSTGFNCTPFNELLESGRLPKAGYAINCQDRTKPTSGAIDVHLPISFLAVSAAFVVLKSML